MNEPECHCTEYIQDTGTGMDGYLTHEPDCAWIAWFIWSDGATS